MSAQTISEPLPVPIWSGWQNAVINGIYPLQRLVHGSEHSAVFLTECKGQAVASAALKIIPIERVTLAQLSHWKVATSLSHPHLIQLFDAGLCHLGGRQFLFVVTEFADQTLGEVLGQRALTDTEVRELLPPTLEALTFLHRQGLVLGHLKPANVLVVNDQIKLAIDSIRCTGAPRVGLGEPSFYDPPEASHAPFSPAGDIWGLGVTLVEALTQRLPRSNEQSRTAVLPPTVPPSFHRIVQRCLSFDPASRPSASDLEVSFAGVPQAPTAPVAQAIAPEATGEIALAQETPARRTRLLPFAAIVFLILLAAVWGDLRLFHGPTTTRELPAGSVQASTQPAATVAQVAAPNQPAQPPRMAAVHEQLPDVARGALRTIHGRIKIAVLVVVDRSGAVIDAHLKNTGPSSYFAGRAREAAKRWRFAPSSEAGTRAWLVRFEFTRGGVTAGATANE
ncbi:MAG TPA: protein kinase [Steroidobacteraceae bacterium]|nr:protein kinase [Steroidobacteraceae bacterium]